MRPGPAERLAAPAIPIDRDRIAAFCRKWHVTRMALFGSVLRTDFSPESDVDVLVEFERGKTPGWDFFGLHEELSPIFGGRRVDLGTFSGLNPHIRDDVYACLETIFPA